MGENREAGTGSAVAAGRLHAVLVVAALALFAANLSMIIGAGLAVGNAGLLLGEIDQGISDALAAAEPEEKPKISLVSIADSSCTDCFSLKGLSDAVRALDVEISGERTLEYGSGEAQALIEKYSIEKIPSLIIGGETAKVEGLAESWQNAGSIENDGALVLREVSPVYLEAATGEYRGRVKITLLTDSGCERCSTPIGAEQFRAAGVSVVSEVAIEAGTSAGQELIEKYAIEKIPATVVSEDVAYYKSLLENLAAIGSFEEDGKFVVREVSPVYIDLAEGREVGETSVTYLSDSQCAECYDVNVHRGVLESNFGVFIGSEKYVDVESAEGEEIIGDYNIVNVPTVIVSGDVAAYSLLASVWPQVGTEEGDGSYVFRNIGALGDVVYKNLETGEILGLE